MPLRYADPNHKHGIVARAFARFVRSGAGQFFTRHVAARTDPWLDRVTGGRLNWATNMIPTATLRTTGAKSGQPREAQITYFHDGHDAIAIASNYGGAAHPQWYYNLVAHPECELGGDKFHAAEVTDPDEYERLYGLAAQVFPGYRDYRAKTSAIGRHIPVFRLTPRQVPVP